MRRTCLALVCLLTISVSPLAPRVTAADGDLLRLRSEQATGQRLIRDGLSKSATFRALADRLQHSDVIVYVRVRMDMPAQTGGSLKFLARSATDRFVLVSLNITHSWPTLIALLGHELQHAVEVADAPGVTSDDGLRALYRDIGVPVGRDAYDSKAAQIAGQVVRAEITHRPIETRVARHTPTSEDVLLEGGDIN
jgi:hypothetical protein